MQTVDPRPATQPAIAEPRLAGVSLSAGRTIARRATRPGACPGSTGDFVVRPLGSVLLALWPATSTR